MRMSNVNRLTGKSNNLPRDVELRVKREKIELPISDTPLTMGIDPGLQGMACLINSQTGMIIKSLRCNDLDQFRRLVLEHRKDCTFVMEDPLSAVRATGQGIRQMYNFGSYVGTQRGIIFALTGCDPVWMTPQLWKKQVGLIGTPKEASVGRARTLLGWRWKAGNCPDLVLPRARTESVDLADAYLIARAYLDATKRLDIIYI